MFSAFVTLPRARPEAGSVMQMCSTTISWAIIGAMAIIKMPSQTGAGFSSRRARKLRYWRTSYVASLAFLMMRPAAT